MLKCWLPAFSPFLTMFSKGFFSRVVKSREKISCCSKLKTVADDKLKVAQMMISVFDMKENMGKGEHVGDQHYVLFT